MAEILTAIAALITAVIAILAFLMAAKQLSELRREREQAEYHNKLALLPAVVILTENYNAAERLGIGIRNVGGAGAIITEMKVSYNGASLSIIDQPDWVNKLADKLKEINDRPHTVSTGVKGEPWLRNVGTATVSMNTPFGAGQDFGFYI